MEFLSALVLVMILAALRGYLKGLRMQDAHRRRNDPEPAMKSYARAPYPGESIDAYYERMDAASGLPPLTPLLAKAAARQPHAFEDLARRWQQDLAARE